MRELFERISFRTHNSAELPDEVFWLLLILGLLIFIWDLFDRHSKKFRSSAGLDSSTQTVALHGSSHLKGTTYESQVLGLTSRPDAVVQEGDFLIPVDVQPMSNKVRDRHVVQMLVHLRLLEEAQGKRPPYGILLMGKAQRPVKIKNSDDKQRWLQTLIDEMQSIQNGVPAIPAPSFQKCKHCDVRSRCSHSSYHEQPHPTESIDEA